MSYWRYCGSLPSEPEGRQFPTDTHRPSRTDGEPQSSSAESLNAPCLGQRSPSLTGSSPCWQPLGAVSSLESSHCPHWKWAEGSTTRLLPAAGHWSWRPPSGQGQICALSPPDSPPSPLPLFSWPWFLQANRCKWILLEFLFLLSQAGFSFTHRGLADPSLNLILPALYLAEFIGITGLGFKDVGGCVYL